MRTQIAALQEREREIRRFNRRVDPDPALVRANAQLAALVALRDQVQGVPIAAQSGRFWGQVAKALEGPGPGPSVEQFQAASAAIAKLVKVTGTDDDWPHKHAAAREHTAAITGPTTRRIR